MVIMTIIHTLVRRMAIMVRTGLRTACSSARARGSMGFTVGPITTAMVSTVGASTATAITGAADIIAVGSPGAGLIAGSTDRAFTVEAVSMAEAAVSMEAAAFTAAAVSMEADDDKSAQPK